MERVLSSHGGHVPSVPNLSPSELKTLRQIFDSNRYASESSAQANGGSNILMVLFARGLSVRFDRARQTFLPLDLDRLIESGLLCKENNEVKARFQAQPYSDLILFSDFFQWESARGFVLPIGPAGNYLALLTIRRQIELTLDLGCGCGIQSLLAARHSQRVIATDINPRALALTRLNAKLNDIHNIETRQGSYFVPAEGQRFDLILANLPYVIAPEKNLVYRNVDKPGDASVHERLKEISSYLNEGGFAQILINWIHRKDQEPSEPIRQTMEDKDVDVWLIHNGSKSPDEYADMWLKHQNQDSPHKAQRTKRNWMRWYRSQHIEQIALGAITLRRRSNKRNWFCSATVNKTLDDSVSEQFLRLFAAQDYLDEIEDPSLLLNEIFMPTDLDFVGNENQPTAYANYGSQFELKIRPMTKAVLQKLDGQTRLEDAIQATLRESGIEASDKRHEILSDIRELLKLGMIAPQQFTPSTVPPSADRNQAI